MANKHRSHVLLDHLGDGVLVPLGRRFANSRDAGVGLDEHEHPVSARRMAPGTGDAHETGADASDLHDSCPCRMRTKWSNSSNPKAPVKPSPAATQKGTRESKPAASGFRSPLVRNPKMVLLVPAMVIARPMAVARRSAGMCSER